MLKHYTDGNHVYQAMYLVNHVGLVRRRVREWLEVCGSTKDLETYLGSINFDTWVLFSFHDQEIRLQSEEEIKNLYEEVASEKNDYYDTSGREFTAMFYEGTKESLEKVRHWIRQHFVIMPGFEKQLVEMKEGTWVVYSVFERIFNPVSSVDFYKNYTKVVATETWYPIKKSCEAIQFDGSISKALDIISLFKGNAIYNNYDKKIYCPENYSGNPFLTISSGYWVFLPDAEDLTNVAVMSDEKFKETYNKDGDYY